MSGPSLVGGVEAGGTKFVCALGTGPGDIRDETRFPTGDPSETLDRVAAFFEASAERHGPPVGVGVASFGPLDLQRGSPTWGWITSTPKPGWRDVDVAGGLARRLGLPVTIDTDVNGAALAEGRWGAARDVAHHVYVTVGTGIGGGGVLNGRPMHGLTHPEMGHLPVRRDPARDAFPGGCPFHGDCLEGLASGPAMEARWGAPPETLPPDHPAWALEAGYLADLVVTLTLVLSPQRIVMGGGLMRHPGLLAAVGGIASERLGGYVRSPTLDDGMAGYLVAPGLGERSGVLGALALAQAAADAGI